jgi:hypothetical protein
MFGEPIGQISMHARTGASQLFSEFVATFGLLSVILSCVRKRPEAVALAVGLYIRRVLVHRIDIICEPGGNNRSRVDQYVCRHSAARARCFAPAAFPRNTPRSCVAIWNQMAASPSSMPAIRHRW